MIVIYYNIILFLRPKTSRCFARFCFPNNISYVFLFFHRHIFHTYLLKGRKGKALLKSVTLTD
jgi:hypothetical protein